MQARVFDASGRPIDAAAVPHVPAPLVDPQLRQRLTTAHRSTDPTELIPVRIALRVQPRGKDGSSEFGQAEIRRGEVRQVAVDGVTLEPLQVETHLDQQQRVRTRSNLSALEARNATVRAFVARHGLEKQQGVKQLLDSVHHTLNVQLTADQLQGLIDAADPVVVGLELQTEAEDDINSAMADTSISSSALPYSSTRGNGIGIYMTESGCANESRITNYDRLAGSETNHSRNVGAIIRAVSPDSRLYCRGGEVLPTFFDLAGFPPFIPALNPPIEVVTRSNSSNDSTSYNTLDRDWDNFVVSWRKSTFNSGGNTGNGTGNVRSPGKGLNIITVGNYRDSTDSIWSSSPFVDPNTGNQKPEVSAPGVSITAGGFTMTGTSMSTPHAAAFTADMMSSSTYLKGKPYLAKAKLLAGATDVISGGANAVGLGGIDFASAHWSGYAYWWEGGNGSFNSFASSDGGTSNSYLERRVYISSGWDRTRVVISWLNDGSHSYANRNSAHPIGQDFDVRVYAPNGSYVGGSFSWDNPYESVNFSPTQSGYYTVKINRYANRDTDMNLRLGLYVNYYDN